MAGLNVIINGILWDSFVMEVSSALLRGIWNLTYFFYCIRLRLLCLFNCECTRTCIIEELIC